VAVRDMEWFDVGLRMDDVLEDVWVTNS
jgi:hypothetical protein